MLQQTPQVVKNLIILNVLMYVLAQVMGDAIAVPLLAGTYPASPFFQPWQIITHMFMHGDLSHIFFNMFALFMFGSQLERVWGPKRFLNYYLACGLGAFFLHEVVVGYGYFMDYGTWFPTAEALFPNLGYSAAERAAARVFVPVVGASGAVYGVMVAFAMLYPRTPIMLLLLPPLEARYVVTGIIALDVLLLNSGGNVARFVHLGGALGGYGLMKFRQKGGDLSLIPRYFDYLYTTYLSKILSPMFALFNGSGKTKKTGSSTKSSMYSWRSNQTQPNRKRTATRRGTAPNINGVSDAEILEEVEQSELDTILDKISKSGYNALSKQEKKTLFELSKRKEP